MQASSKIRILAAVLRRPSLWLTALQQAARLMPAGWYTRSPFLPVPPADYMEFRLVTQYGGDHGAAQATSADVVAYLKWCKQWNDGRA
jgi:hypothetical protein